MAFNGYIILVEILMFDEYWDLDPIKFVNDFQVWSIIIEYRTHCFACCEWSMSWKLVT